MREAHRVLRVGGKALALGTLEPSKPIVRFFATTFNRFPKQQDYVQWFEEAGFQDVQTKLVANPWNEQQFAIAIIGTKTEANPALQRSVVPSPSAAPLRVVRSLLSLPFSLLRFGLSMAAFAVVGPMQIAAASMHMRRAGAR